MNSRRTGWVSESSGPAISQRTGEPAHHLGTQIRERRGQPARGAAAIRAGENDAGTDNANADLAGPRDRNQDGRVGIHSAGGA
jgi:hypothetical protein